MHRLTWLFVAAKSHVKPRPCLAIRDCLPTYQSPPMLHTSVIETARLNHHMVARPERHGTSTPRSCAMDLVRPSVPDNTRFFCFTQGRRFDRTYAGIPVTMPGLTWSNTGRFIYIMWCRVRWQLEVGSRGWPVGNAQPGRRTNFGRLAD